jgi:hypothetical protein
MSNVFIYAIFLAGYFLRAINNPSSVARIKHLQCVDGFLFIAFVSLYIYFWKPLWKIYTFDVYFEVKSQIFRSKYYHIYSIPLFSVLCVF